MKKAGRRLHTEHLEIRYSDSLLSHARVAVVVGKHGHTIVERNQLRRRLRELIRVKLIPVLTRIDIVLRAQASAYEAPYTLLADEVDTLRSRMEKSAGEK